MSRYYELIKLKDEQKLTNLLCVCVCMCEHTELPFKFWSFTILTEFYFHWHLQSPLQFSFILNKNTTIYTIQTPSFHKQKCSITLIPSREMKLFGFTVVF